MTSSKIARIIAQSSKIHARREYSGKASSTSSREKSMSKAKKSHIKAAIASVFESLHRVLFGYMVKQGLILCVANTDDGDGSAAATEQAKIDAAVQEAVAGLKSKNSELIAIQKAQKEALKNFEGIDPDKYRQFMSKFESDEDRALLEAGKIEEVVAKRAAKRDAEWQKKLDAVSQAAETEKARAEKFLGRVLDDQIRAAVNGKVHEKAVEDALFRARMMFTLDDNGNAVQKDADGAIVIGKDGKNPFTPSEWIESMRDAAPHWFPATGSGSGAQQHNGSGAMGKAALMALPPKERMEAARRH